MVFSAACMTKSGGAGGLLAKELVLEVQEKVQKMDIKNFTLSTVEPLMISCRWSEQDFLKSIMSFFWSMFRDRLLFLYQSDNCFTSSL